MSRRTVLVAWELGGGMGHLARLAPLAAALANLGHRVVFALRDAQHAEMAKRAVKGATILASPLWSGTPSRKVGPAYTYADLLYGCGYDSPQGLRSLVTRWHALFGEVAPNLVLCDHSPTAVLAAVGRLPVVHIGSGFATPPSGRPLQVLHAGSYEGAAEREADVLHAIRTVIGDAPKRTIEAVADLFSEAVSFPCCLPELDPYRATRGAEACGPTQRLPHLQPPPRDGTVFGYLTAEDPDLPKLLASLGRAKLPCEIFVRQLTPELRAEVAGSSVTLLEGPRKMPDALANAAAVIHHAGLATTEMALALGRPQFLWPRNLEQFLTGKAVESLGCGIDLRRQRMDPGLLIRKASEERTHEVAVAAAAARIADRPARDVAGNIVEACLARLM